MTRQLPCLGADERFQQHQSFWRNVQTRQPYLDDWHPLSVCHLLHNICISPLELGIGTAFFGRPGLDM